jgi:hypothetical protein
MDNTVMEYTAEDLIAHKLQRSGILVAKPKFDQEGADLLGLLGVEDGARFCRIQCKGRSLYKSSQSSVDVFKKYVTDGFLLFLFVETGDKEETHLFCFLGKQIRELWSLSSDSKKYVLSLSKALVTSGWDEYRFSDKTIDSIREVIKHLDVREEFSLLNRGYGELVLPKTTFQGSGIHIPQENTIE